MILAIPVGRDCLYLNAARVYGKLRLSLLLQGWDIIDAFGFTGEEFFGQLGSYSYQPIFYLTPNIKPPQS